MVRDKYRRLKSYHDRFVNTHRLSRRLFHFLIEIIQENDQRNQTLRKLIPVVRFVNPFLCKLNKKNAYFSLELCRNRRTVINFWRHITFWLECVATTLKSHVKRSSGYAF